MPKKPITPVIEEDQDALDDETFAELDADEELLHASLQNPQSIRSDQATSIAKTKPRRSTLGLPKAIIMLNPEKWGDTDGSDPEWATAPVDTVATGAARDPTISPHQEDGAQSLSKLRGAIDREDASTQREYEDLTLERQAPHTGKYCQFNSRCPQKLQSKASLPQKLVKGRSARCSRLQKYMGPRAK